MMLATALLIASVPMRPEPVQGRPAVGRDGRTATRSGRTGKAPRTAVDAERAFAADAPIMGQWAAFRKWATADAIMFLPQPERMQTATRTWPEPAQAVRWSPAASFVSCDGQMAANTGPSLDAKGRHGYFSTIWVRQPEGGWKWTVDAGAPLAAPRWPLGAAPVVRRASCVDRPGALASPAPQGRGGGGVSPDRTLIWRYDVAASGAREFVVEMWTGARYEPVIQDRVAAPTS